MYDESTYNGERSNEMDLRVLLQVLESITTFQRRWQARIERFNITGGDPLLHPQWMDLLKELRDRGKTIGIFGNPETLTARNLRALERLGIWSFQMSLDGLEETHDSFRSPGSFRRTVKAIEKLRDHGIRPNIMFTLFPQNRADLIPLLHYLAVRTGIHAFIFDIGTSIGNATSLEGTLHPGDLKKLCADYLREKRLLKEQGLPLTIVEKSHFLKIARFEESTFYPFPSRQVPVVSGCLAGWTSVAILSDGTVLPCRRYPVSAGKIPDKSFEEILLGSEVMRRFRRAQYFNGCGECSFYRYCRGCPAVVRGLTGDGFSGNPLCFRKMLSRTPPADFLPALEIPPSLSAEEEHNLISGHFSNYVVEHGHKLMRDGAIRALLRLFSLKPEEKRLFLQGPDEYLADHNHTLSELQKLVLGHSLLDRETQQDSRDILIPFQRAGAEPSDEKISDEGPAQLPPGFHRRI